MHWDRGSRCGLRGWTVLFVLASLASACGGEPRPTGPTTTVRMGFSAWPGWLPWQIALEENLFEPSGARVDLTYFESYTESLAALGDGRLDANTQTLNDTLSSVAGGSDQVIVLVNDYSSGNDQCIAREGISNIADLRGRVIAVEFGVVDHFLLLLALRRAGVDPSEVTIENVLTDVAAENFAMGMYDAVCVFAPFTTTALERPGSIPLVTSQTFPGAIPDYLVVTRDLAENHPSDVQALVNTWWRVRRFMENNPTRAVEIMAARAGVSTPEYDAYAQGTTLLTLEQNVETLGPTPGDCSTLGIDARLYTECTALSIADFLYTDAMLIRAPLSEAQIRGSWTDRFVRGATQPD